jgi:phosphoribosylformylglycinamidine synthase
VLPGGFSYGDYLRTGAIARFSPVMEAVASFAETGKPVIGICNGFQVLCESHLLPGVLIRNQSLEFRCEWVHLRREGGSTPWADGIRDGEVIRIPISHGEGNYYADNATLDELELKGRVVFRYCDAAGEVTLESNPNGSARNIAGIINARGNVLGMMPHPERAGEALVGGSDGNRLWESLIRQAAAIVA